MEIIKESQKQALLEFVQKRSPLEKKIFVLAMVGVFLGVDIYFWGWPITRQLLIKMKDLESIQSQLKDREREVAAKDKVTQQWSDMIEKVNQKKKTFFYEGEVSALMGYLFRQASESGLKIMNLIPTEDKPKTIKNILFQEVFFKIDAVGNVHHLGRFIERLENGPFFLKIRNISITSDPAENKKNIIQLDLKIIRKREEK